MPALPIYTTPAMRKLEELAAPASGTLMERAGAAAAEFARGLCSDTAKAVLVVAGPGNNGGDAFEVAVHLKRWFFRVSVVFSGERDKLPKDAQAALGKWEAAGGTLLHGIPGESRFDLAVDGLFGTGLKRPLAGAHGALVQKLNALGVPILALDVPSGIDADTGAIMGSAVRASHTITFIAYKPGLLTLDGPETQKLPQGTGRQRRRSGRRRGNGRGRGDRRPRRPQVRSRARLSRTAHCAPPLHRRRATGADAAEARGGSRKGIGRRPGRRAGHGQCRSGQE